MNGPGQAPPDPDTAQTGTVEDIRDARIRELEERREQKEKEWKRYQAEVEAWMASAEETVARGREALIERTRLLSELEALQAVNRAQEEELAEYRRLFEMPIKLSDIAKRIDREAA